MPKEQDQDLPGMEDRSIKALENLAAQYADIRDRRMALNEEEGNLKRRILTAMKKHEKDIYRRDGIEIQIVPHDEDVKVKIRKREEPEAKTDAAD